MVLTIDQSLRLLDPRLITRRSRRKPQTLGELLSSSVFDSERLNGNVILDDPVYRRVGDPPIHDILYMLPVAEPSECGCAML